MGTTRNALGRRVHAAIGPRSKVPRIVWQRYTGLRSTLNRLYKSVKAAPEAMPMLSDIECADAAAIAVGFWILHDTNEGCTIAPERLEAWGALDAFLRRARTAADIAHEDREGFDLSGTVTGRFSAAGPNMQQLGPRTPAGKSLRDAFAGTFPAVRRFSEALGMQPRHGKTAAIIDLVKRLRDGQISDNESMVIGKPIPPRPMAPIRGKSASMIIVDDIMPQSYSVAGRKRGK